MLIANRKQERSRPHRHLRRWSLWLLAALFASSAGVARVCAGDAATMKAYQQQFQALAADDLDGHVKLALWCRDEKAWDLLVRQSSYVLTVDPDHRLAKLLLDLGKSKGGGSAGHTATPNTGPSPSAAPGAPAKKTGLLSTDQVQVLRRKELRLNAIERVRVKFRNDVEDRFWNLMSLREGLTRRDQVAYRKLRAVQKAQLILSKIAQYDRAGMEDNTFNDEYSADILIETDPMIFKEYKTNVWPIIARGCATSGCHSGSKAAPPVLYNERRMSDEKHYTNYLILHDYKKGERRLINRDFPAESLLLVYGQPIAGNQSSVHPTEIRPLFQSARDRKYVILGRWISALGVPGPDYGFTADDL